MRAKPATSTSAQTVRVGNFEASNRRPLFFIAGLCAFESEEMLGRVGRELKKIFDAAQVPWVLKCSFDKANRTSIRSYRGAGISKALQSFAKIKRELGVPFLTDVHETTQVSSVARVADILQIPAFLCRQTDLLLACGKSNKPVNIKKGQFLSPWDMRNAIDKVQSTGNRKILLTERGTTFGYGNLVVDMRSLEIMKDFGYPVIFDATHSVQLPGGLGHATGGDRRFAVTLTRAAAAVGVAGIFLETHPNPDRALSDGPNSVRLADVAQMVRTALQIDKLIKGTEREISAQCCGQGWTSSSRGNGEG